MLQRPVHLAHKTGSVDETDQPKVGGTRAHIDLRTVRLRRELNICPFELVRRHKDRIWAPLDLLAEACRHHGRRNGVARTQLPSEHSAHLFSGDA